jgi:DNA replication and repair protein RecF
MKIDSLNLINFRNYKNLNIEFSNFLNIIYGLNGSGKTNLVEAIYLLSLTKSFRISNDKILIKKGSIKTKVRGEVTKGNDTSSYSVEIGDEGKVVLINDQKIDKVSDYISKINVILFSPTDIRIIDEAPEKRRRILNIEISSIYKEYLVILADYQKILKQRNFYLRGMYVNGNYKTDFLDILTKKMIEYGIKIFKYRDDFINNINKYITKIYQDIFDVGSLKIRYVSSYKNKSADEIFKMYQKNYQKEMIIGKSLYGIHHDDIEFIIESGNLKEIGSQGQRKNAIIAFKLAELNVIYDLKKYYPILILDDLFSELDKGKVMNIFKILNKSVQTFITTTEIKNVNKKVLKNARVFKVNDANIEEEKHE